MFRGRFRWQLIIDSCLPVHDLRDRVPVPVQDTRPIFHRSVQGFLKYGSTVQRSETDAISTYDGSRLLIHSRNFLGQLRHHGNHEWT